MSVLELVAPQTQTLTSLARVKAEMGIKTTEQDERLSDLILEASALIVREIGYPVWRARVQERVTGYGRSELMLSRTPIVRVESVAVEGVPVPSTDYQVDANVGVLLHRTQWGYTRHVGLNIDPYERPDEGQREIVVDYWGGYLGPDDDVPASGIAVSGSADRYQVTNAPLVVEGDKVQAVGFGQAANNGRFVVTARSETGISVDHDLVDEAAAPANARLKVRNLDPGLERLCVQTVKAWLVGSDRDPSVTSERIGDWSASYGTANADLAHELPPGVVKALNRYLRTA